MLMVILADGCPSGMVTEKGQVCGWSVPYVTDGGQRRFGFAQHEFTGIAIDRRHRLRRNLLVRHQERLNHHRSGKPGQSAERHLFPHVISHKNLNRETRRIREMEKAPLRFA